MYFTIEEGGGTAADAYVYMLDSADSDHRKRHDSIVRAVGEGMRLDTDPVTAKRRMFDKSPTWPNDGPVNIKVPRWFIRLFSAANKRYNSGLESDIHSGNLGMRSNGDWVFFD
jgi:hypothetical protein